MSTAQSPSTNGRSSRPAAYTLASTYPLAAPLGPPGVDHDGLLRFGRLRHRAALEMLAALDADLR